MRWYIIPTAWLLETLSASRAEELVDSLSYDLVCSGAGEARVISALPSEDDRVASEAIVEVAVWAASDEQALQMGREIWPLIDVDGVSLSRIDLPRRDGDGRISPPARTMLSWARDWIVDNMPVDLRALNGDAELVAEIVAVTEALPVCYADLYDGSLLERYANVVAVTYELLTCDGDQAELGCTAQLIAAHALICGARRQVRHALASELVSHEHALELIDELDDLHDALFADCDALMLFELGPDGMSGYDASSVLGIRHLHPRDWFTPYDDVEA